MTYANEDRHDGHVFSITDDAQDMNQYVSKHGLEAALKNVSRLAEALNYPMPKTWRLFTRDGSTPTQTPRQQPHFNRQGKRITEIRHQGGLAAWATRRAIDAMVAANPRLSRVAAAALYRDANPVPSKAKLITAPRKAGTKGEKSWDSRIRNQIKKAFAAGEIIDWEEGHRRALASLQGSRIAA